jgi:hypothetical protein
LISSSSGFEISGVAKVATLYSAGLQYFAMANARMELGIGEAIGFPICSYMAECDLKMGKWRCRRVLLLFERG